MAIMHRAQLWELFPVSDFGRSAATWDALVASGRYPPFLRSDFAKAALRAFGTGRELLAVYGDASAPTAMAILSSKFPGVWETFQPSQLPLGAFVHDGSMPLEDVLATLLPALPGVAAVVAITQQDPDIVPRPADNARLRTLDYIDTARVVVGGTFDAYWAARGKNLRTNVKRQRAKLDADRVVVELDVVDTPGRVGSAIADYGRLESAGWKATGGTAVATGSTQGRFYARVFESFCAAGKGRIYRFLVDGKVAAMDLCIEDAGVVVVLKTAYDETLKAVSPATLMRHEYFRQLFDAGTVNRIEFYGKVMEWHRRWTDEIRTLYHVNGYRAGWVRKAHELLRRDGNLSKAAPEGTRSGVLPVPLVTSADNTRAISARSAGRKS
jgi:CelD/BcsL family acetyltransferase involved in cellulose biosynthesis